MSGTGETRLDFAGEERTFRIRLGEIRRIEDKSKTGVGEVVRRLSRCVYMLEKLGGIEALASGVEIHAEDVRETLYQGLLGGGMAPSEATGLLRREIDDRGLRGLLDNAPTALTALWGSQEVPEDDAPGEPRAGESPATPNSEPTSASSTASEPSSD